MQTLIFNERPLLTGTCEWCGLDCDPLNSCCCNTCEAQLRRLEAAQGRMVMRSIKRWRLKPNHAARSEMLAELIAKTDRFLRQDQKRRENFHAERRAAAQTKES